MKKLITLSLAFVGFLTIVSEESIIYAKKDKSDNSSSAASTLFSHPTYSGSAKYIVPAVGAGIGLAAAGTYMGVKNWDTIKGWTGSGTPPVAPPSEEPTESSAPTSGPIEEGQSQMPKFNLSEEELTAQAQAEKRIAPASEDILAELGGAIEKGAQYIKEV